MEKKMTAVRWLSNHFSKLKKDGEKMHWQQVIDITNIALELEREQIEEAVIFGDCRGRNTQYLTASEYYTQTYLEPLKDKI